MEAIYVRTRTSPQTGSGKCSVVNGDIIYSPNCSVKSPVLPQSEEPVQFTPNVSQAEDFESARWWKADTEWLGFVPIQPVNYSGVWFDSLSHIPRTPTIADSGMYSLFGPLRAIWLQAEEALIDTANILREKSQLSFVQPFPPRSWKYHLEHPTDELAQYHIRQGRNWFAMWLGLVFWMTRKIPEDRGFKEGHMPPNWFRHVVINHPKHGAMDVLRLSPLLQRMWNIPRVGLWLHHPNDQEFQPSARWFIEQGVPVWYRWGTREKASYEYRGSTFNLIAPSPEELQLVATHITRPVEEHYFNSFNHDSYDDHNTSFASFDDSSVSEPVIAPPKQSAELAYTFWEVHFKKLHERHEKQLKNEPPKKKQARLSRERNPPTASAPVYEWSWNDNNEFVRELQRKSEWVFTLSQYGGRQKRYDSILNQWDCCQYWGPNTEDFGQDVIEILSVGQQDPIPSIYESSPPVLASNDRVLESPESPPVFASNDDVLESPESPGAGAINVDGPSPPDKLQSSEQNPVEKQVLDALMHHFGFVPPTPLPSSSDSSSLSGHTERQFLVSILGLPTQAVLDPFFNSPLGIVCATFIRSFINGKKPADDLWDLSQNNRHMLYFTQRLNSIRTLERTIPVVSSVNNSENVPRPTQTQIFYMFDLGNQATVNWHLAVSSATDAMYVCRLPGDWSSQSSRVTRYKMTSPRTWSSHCLTLSHQLPSLQLSKRGQTSVCIPSMAPRTTKTVRSRTKPYDRATVSSQSTSNVDASAFSTVSSSTKHTPVFRASYIEVCKLKYPNIQPRNDWDLIVLASIMASPSLTSNEKFYAYSDDEMRAHYHNLEFTDKDIKDGRAHAEVIKQATEMLDLPGTIVGVKPRPGDDDVHIRAIPDSDYSIRMWGTNMETNREYCFDFVETATGNPVNSPFEYQLWAVPNKRTPWLPCPSAQLHSLAYNFGYKQKDIPPGEEMFVLLEGTPCILKRPGMRPVYFEAPVRPRSLDLSEFDELDFGIPSRKRCGICQCCNT